MKKFLDNNFLLKTETAIRLYHDYAKKMPIIDYHCHLTAKEIYENKNFNNITEVWLGGDHYKWRLMRANGVSEKFITGDMPPYEKFLQFAKTIQDCLGNPLYHWTHLELRRYFNIYEILNVNTAEKIYNMCNTKLQTADFTPRKLMERSQVEVICTTDDPCDSLEYHLLLKTEYDKVKVLPAFRPDQAINIENEGFNTYLDKLSLVFGHKIKSLTELCQALEMRVDYFHQAGCRVSDHGLDQFMYKKSTFLEAQAILNKKLENKNLTLDEIKQFKGYILEFLGKLYSQYKWVMQLHMQAFRNVNKKMYQLIGANTGYDVAYVGVPIAELQGFLNSLELSSQLPKTIVYSLNSNDNLLLATLLGSFQNDEITGKMQLGAAWWFNDHIEGMLAQMKAVSQVGLLSQFVGMLTDSRSFLSYPRHEYFRRILANFIGEMVENGEYPNDIEHLGEIIQNISYYNALRYFNL